MKLKIIVTTVILTLAVLSYGQQKYCADSSFRIKYIFDTQGATLINNPDTSGKNIFTGSFNGGIALMKTTWGDSIIWAKKILLNGSALNSYYTPDGSVICTGTWGPLNSTEFLLTKINKNGTVLWVKRYMLSQFHITNSSGFRNILIANNAIYCNVKFSDEYSIIAKLDLDGNIIWSTGFSKSLPNFGVFFGAPVYYNNTVIIVGNSGIINTFAGGKTTITKLNDTDGSFIESFAYQVNPNPTIKGIFPLFNKYNTDNSLTITGNATVDISGTVYTSDIIYNTELDTNFNPVHNFYFKNNIPLDAEDDINFNNQKQHAFLLSDGFNFYNKYFVTFDKNDQVLRSRKFVIPANFSSIYFKTVNLDDKENLHFIFHYPQGSQQVTEYARISNFAPSGTLGCFGKDTSILTRYPFSLTKEPFTWSNIASNLITVNDVSYTEDTALVTKQLVCKLVSICDSLKITGPAKICTNQPVRYTFTKNSQCLKERQWVVDTAFVNIISYEADSTFTISFKKPFAGFLRANIYNCVVQDSLFVTAVAPKQAVRFLKRDSLLCPGKSIILKADTGYLQYQWQNGSTADSIIITSPGFYKVTATDYCGNISADSINIKISDTTLIIPATQTICRNDTAFIIFPNDVNNILWQPISNSLLNNKTLLLFPKQTTFYNITAERLANCPITKTSTVAIKICSELIFIPNAFTPNNDSRNDIFKASTFRPLQSYQLIIYNRYGQKIFETANLSAGWDGTFKGSRQPTGGYMYHCSYQFTGGLQRTESGYFILIR